MGGNESETEKERKEGRKEGTKVGEGSGREIEEGIPTFLRFSPTTIKSVNSLFFRNLMIFFSGKSLLL